ncbi:MAG TPA: carboxypeptidase-like regulatory domain-containing protein [Longimicrobium sp.]|uniref:carboxypeptidase-like regulatory domain-containing protein n=1 Tax=Longimicrobium sp. TaxID=2029185 RepID=UPI002EDA3DCB
MQRTRIALRCLLAAAGLLGAAAGHAQTVTGRVVDPATGEPVPGAMVLMRGEGTERRSLADSAGNYVIRAQRPGSYVLVAERVGYGAAPSAPIRLEEGETVRHDLRAGSGRVLLEAITATGRARACEGEVRRGPEAQVLWEEARKVVQSAALTAESEHLSFVTRLHRHERRLNNPNPVRSREWTVTATGRPFASRTAEQLADEGYVVSERDSTVFQGIDAHAILSDAFVQHHCFSVREGGRDRPGLVGLEFMPLRGQPRPDVQGVLWLDRASAELRTVEYRFTGLPYSGAVDRLGGRLRFERLPGGRWIVRDWIVNAPLLEIDLLSPALSGKAPRARVRGLVENGGEVIEIRAAPARTPAADSASPC